MAQQKLDFFSTSASPPESNSSSNAVSRPSKPPISLDDAELIARIPKVGIVEAPLMAMEAGPRRLAGAIFPLEALCLRFARFGDDRRPKCRKVRREDYPQWRCSRAILEDSGRRCCPPQDVLPGNTISDVLRHDDERVRANACRSAPEDPKAMPGLVACLQDHEPEVRKSAACALGRLGRNEALAPLTQLLQLAPTVDVIDAVTSVANEDCIVLL